jgi:spermidine/putrescine transport system permease protein
MNGRTRGASTSRRDAGLRRAVGVQRSTAAGGGSRTPSAATVVVPRVFWTIRYREWVTRIASAGLLAVAAVVLFGPFLLLAFLSFNDSQIMSFGFQGVTTRFYEEALADEAMREALANSLLVAGVTTPICVVLGTLGAFGIARFVFPGRGTVAGSMTLPLVVPSLLVGVGALVTFSRVQIPLSLYTVGVMHIVVGFPLVMAIVTAALYRFDRSLEEAALDLGATRRELLWYVLLPYLVPALAAAAIFVFGWSFNSFTVTFFTVGDEGMFTVWVFSKLRRGTNLPVVNAISTLVTFTTVIVVYVAYYLLRRSAIRSGQDVRTLVAGGPQQ